MGRCLSPCITQNARLYLTETTQLFTQLWASLQSGEADGGVHRHPRLGIAHTYTMQIMKFEASNGTLSMSNNALTYKNLLVPSKL